MLRVHIVWSGDRAMRLRGACIDITERRAVDDLLGRTQAELGQQVADLHRLHELSSRLLDTRTLHRAAADDPGGAGRLPRRAPRPGDAVRHRLGHAGHRHQHRLHARRRRAADADQRHRRRLRDQLRAAASAPSSTTPRPTTSTPACARWRARKASAPCTHAADRPGRRGDRRDLDPPRRAARAHRARAHAGRHLRAQGRDLHRARPRAGRLPGVAGPLPGGARRVGGAVRRAVAGARGHAAARSSTSSGATSTPPPRRRCAGRPTRSRASACRTCCPRAGPPATSFMQYVAVVETGRDARVRDAACTTRASSSGSAASPRRCAAASRCGSPTSPRARDDRAAIAAGRRPPQGRVPRDAGARAAQPARADPPGQRGVAPAAGHRGAEALEPRGHRAPGAPHGAAARRPAGRLAHHARPARAAPRHQHAATR